MGLDNVRHVVLVLSGKGGVGKSSVTLQLALCLSQQGHNVGILDIDLTGPSIPRLLNLEDQKVRQAPGGWLPVPVHSSIEHDGTASNDHTINTRKRGSLHALSLAFLLPSRDSAVIWRGPKKTAMIRQFVSDVLWPPQTDFLLIDTPPGTSDEHIAIVEELHKLALTPPPTPNGQPVAALAGAVVVTTPQAISTSDVRKELNFCTKTQVPVLGVIENMSGYMCPCCGEVSKIFSKGGGEVMARECGVPYLGSVPIDTTFGDLVEGVKRAQADTTDTSAARAETELVEQYRVCGLCSIFNDFARRIVADIEQTR